MALLLSLAGILLLPLRLAISLAGMMGLALLAYGLLAGYAAAVLTATAIERPRPR
ncbi:MAG TPA: hypothetical protein VFR34_07910 [Paracoccaceae bacterium]|nr:hypothetical protein [Paracoccaceae bacterium]